MTNFEIGKKLTVDTMRAIKMNRSQTFKVDSYSRLVSWKSIASTYGLKDGCCYRVKSDSDKLTITITKTNR